MLSSFDDYPIHAGSVPVNETATSDINHYDRYFFNGYSNDGSLYFGMAMGLYPNRGFKPWRCVKNFSVRRSVD